MEDKELEDLRAKLRELQKQETLLFEQILEVQEQIFAEVDRRALENFRLSRKV